MKNKKSKTLFPYVIKHREIIGYSTYGERTHLYKVTRILPKKKTNYKSIFRVSMVLLLLICGAVFLAGCSTTPIVDSRGKSSANIEGTAERYHDDYYTCKSIVEDNTNALVDKSKAVYNGLRWRVLWLSPKLKTRQDLINVCLEGRGYNVINK